MFTGIVQHLGLIDGIEPQAAAARLVIDVQGWVHVASRGESIAVNGCCLTLVDRQGDLWAFDVHGLTLERTTLGGAQVGRAVNLEHAATPTTLLGGHLVQGHIDGIGRVEAVEITDGGTRLRVSCPPSMRGYLVDRGSITIDGVSLTVADVTDDGFACALIPETLAQTTFGKLKAGEEVNLEVDAIMRMVERLMATSGGAKDA